jgi:HAMP domain-containing protein
MRGRTLVGLWLSIGLVAGAVAAHGDPQRFADTQAIVQFQRDADAYAFMHRQVERRLRPLEVTTHADSIRQAIADMAAGIRAARPQAREGELFKAPVRQVFKDRIVKAMRANDLTIADLEPERPEPEAGLLVNDDMPWRLTSATPACVIEALPPLPPELQYRFIGADLLLVDIHANVIVDILRGAALPMDTIR